MRLVEGDLLVATALGFANGSLHGASHIVGIKNGAPVEVTGRAADGLDQRALGTQEALLVGVEDRHQRHLGHVQTFAQQVDAHQHIEHTQAQITNDLYALYRVDIRVQITHPHAVVAEVVGEVFSHALGQRRDQHPLFLDHTLVDFREQIVDLSQGRPHLDLRVHQARRTHHLLDHPTGVLRLIGPRSGGDENRLRAYCLPLIETHRPIIKSRRQPKPVLDQRFLARTVAFVHGADLRHADVGLVDHEQRIGRQVIVEGRWRFARGSPRQIARVVLDAVAVAQLHDHFQIETGALLQPLRLYQLVVATQVVEAIFQLRLDVLDGVQQRFPRRDVVALGIKSEARQLADDLASQRVERRQALHLIVEQLDTHRFQIRFGRIDIDHIATHAKGRTGEIHFIAGVLQTGESAQQLTLIQTIASIDVEHHFQVGFGATQTVDAGHCGHNDRVRPLQQRLGR